MLNLDDVSLLSHQRSNLFFGDTFRFATRDNYQIQTSLYTLQNSSGASGILAQLSGMSAGSEDWQPIILRNSYLGLGQINNVRFAPGVDVRLKNVNIDLTIYNSGNTFNLPTDNLYSGVNFSSTSFPIYLVEQLSEDFSCDVLDDGSYSERQSIKIQMRSGSAIGNILNPISMAQQLADNLIKSNPPVGFIDNFYSGWRRQPGRRRRTESINLINNTVDINESFKILKGISGSYSINYTNSLNVNENGITSVSERGRVQGLIPDNQGQYYYSAYSGMQYEVNNFSYLRCNNLFNSYQLGTAYPLNSRRLMFGQGLNKFSDIVTYEVSYSNDPRINDNFSWEYTQNIQRDQNNCTYQISENGNVVGLSTDCSPAAKYSNALTAYSGVKTGVYLRTYNFYTGFSTFANPIKLISQSENKSKFKGTIQYEFTYSDNLLFSTSGVKKMSISLTDDHAVPLVNYFDVVNLKQIAQPANIPTLARRTLDLEIVGNRGTNLTGYLDIAKTTVNAYPPTGTDPYISNLNYSFSPLNNLFNLSTEWTYEESINLNQFIL